MRTSPATGAAALFSLFAWCAAAPANEYSALLREKKYAEVERTADATLARSPNDAAALAAKSEAIVAMDPGRRADEAVRLAEQCIAAHPRQSICYLASGNSLGAKALHATPVSAIGYATRIRDAFSKAVQLDPHNTDARFALLDYYLQAPSLVGGGKGRARDLAARTEAINPAAARLMQAQLALADKDFERAEAGLLAVQPGNDEMVADRQRQLLTMLAQRYHASGRPADSERVLRIVQQRFPE